MSDFGDLEHDTQEETPSALGTTPDLGPVPTDQQLDHEEAIERLQEHRRREEVMTPKDRKAMLAQRYRIIKPTPEQIKAQAEWLSPDNDELWTPL